MATIVHADGSEEYLDDCSLASLQSVVGGFIQIVSTVDGKLVVLDEEGKLKSKALNLRATEMLKGRISDTDYIVGDVVVATTDEID